MRLECPFPHVLALQCAAGDRTNGQSPLLAAADAGPWEVPGRVARAPGTGAGAIGGGTVPAINLGSRRLSRRGSGGQRAGRRAAAALPAASGGRLDHNEYGPEAGVHTLWRGKRILLSSRFCLCDTTLPGVASARIDCDCRKRVLAKFL